MANFVKLFAQPTLLWLLLLAPATMLLLWYAARMRLRGLEQLARALPQRRFARVHTARRRMRAALSVAGIFLLSWACAGPRWGQATQSNVASDQDLAVVLDLSRSMQAEQPSRRVRGVRALRRLADAFEKRGGRRVSLIVFAARARLLFPMTQDLDHWRSVLSQIEENDLPALGGSADEPLASGTRIGAALQLALESHDSKRPGGQAVLLLSDGDDPAGDEEWQQGVQQAKILGIPIHVVGVGDPAETFTIPQGEGVLRFAGKPVRTRIDEAVLQEIARRTGGVYLPALASDLPLGTLLPPILEQRQADPDDHGDSERLEQEPRHAWFLLAALACFASTLLLTEGTRSAVAVVPRRGKVLGALGVLLLVSAGPIDEDWIRQGNEAFEQKEYAQAVECYGKAEAFALDPGLVAFNKGAAQYRLGRFAEAELSYRRCLDDDRAPPRRRAMACFELGNCLLRQGSDENAIKFRLAVEAYHVCLMQSDLDADLRKDARHNLELAQILWLRARAKHPDNPEGNGTDPTPNLKNKTETKIGQGDPSSPTQEPADPMQNPGGAPSKQKGESAMAGKQVAVGPLEVLPDDDKVQPLSSQELSRRLAREAQRIAAARRAWRIQQSAPHPVGKDW